MKVLAALMIVICCAHAAARELKIPEVGDLPRIDRNSPRPTREAAHPAGRRALHEARLQIVKL